MSWRSELKDIHALLESIKEQDEVKRVIAIIKWHHFGSKKSIEVTPSIYSVWKELDPDYDDRHYNHHPEGLPKDFASIDMRTIPEDAKSSFNEMAPLFSHIYEVRKGDSLFDYFIAKNEEFPYWSIEELGFVHSTPQFEEIAKQFWATYNEGRRKEAVKLLPELKEAIKNAFMRELCMEIPMTKFAGKE